MRRHPDWEHRLDAHFTRSRGRAFCWGSFDCALAICEGIAAITGLDPGADFRGRYASLEEAAALMAVSGSTFSLEGPSQMKQGSDLGNLAAGIAATFNFPEVPPAFARRGDVVLVDNGDPLHALGTVDLSGRFAWCVGERGQEPCWVRFPMRRWLRAWRIE